MKNKVQIALSLWIFCILPSIAWATTEPIAYEEDPIFCERKFSFLQGEEIQATCPEQRYAELLAPKAFREEVNHYNETVTRTFQDHRSNSNFLAENSTYELRRHRQCLYNICDILQDRCSESLKNNSNVPQQQSWCYQQAEQFYQIQQHKTQNNIMRNQARKSRALTNQKYTALSTRMKRHFHYRVGDTIRQLNRFASKVTAYIEDPQVQEATTESESIQESPAKQEQCTSSGGAGCGNKKEESGGGGGGSGGESGEEEIPPKELTEEELAEQKRIEELKAKEDSGEISPEEKKELDAKKPAPGAGSANDGIIEARVTKKGTYDSGVAYHDGTITVNGNTYEYRSGGYGRGDTPAGAGQEYVVTPHKNFRSDSGFSIPDNVTGSGNFGYSYKVESTNLKGTDQVYDPRYSTNRDYIRIHPDGNSCGTNGCFGIQGDAAVQRKFREDLNTEIKNNGGQVKLKF